MVLIQPPSSPPPARVEEMRAGWTGERLLRSNYRLSVLVPWTMHFTTSFQQFGYGIHVWTRKVMEECRTPLEFATLVAEGVTKAAEEYNPFVNLASIIPDEGFDLRLLQGVHQFSPARAFACPAVYLFFYRDQPSLLIRSSYAGSSNDGRTVVLEGQDKIAAVQRVREIIGDEAAEALDRDPSLRFAQIRIFSQHLSDEYVAAHTIPGQAGVWSKEMRGRR